MTLRAEEAKQTLLSLLEKIAEERKYVDYSTVIEELNDSGSGACLTSVLFLATLRACAKPDLKLFGKVAALSVESRKPFMRCFFSPELHFYTKVAKQFERIEDENNVPLEHRLLLPKLYGSRHDYLYETLVLEDLSAQGFHKFDRDRPADLEYVSAAIEVMAKYHALSLAYHHDSPEDFKKTLEALKMDDSKAEAMIILMKPKLLASAYASAEKHRGRLEKYFAQEPCPILQFVKFYRSKNRNILVHGDFKTSNLMHRRRNGKLEIIPVDFQLTRDGDPVVDLLYFLFTVTDEDFRRAHFHDILDQYYVQLCKALQRLHLDSAVVYPENTYREELKECSMWGLTVAIILLPMIMVEEDKLPAFNEEYDVTDLVMETGAAYRRRFNGVLNNYVEWGLL